MFEPEPWDYKRPWFAETALVFAAIKDAAGRAAQALWEFGWHGSPARMRWFEGAGPWWGLLLSVIPMTISLAGMALAAAFGLAYLAAWVLEGVCWLASGGVKPETARRLSLLEVFWKTVHYRHTRAPKKLWGHLDRAIFEIRDRLWELR